VARRRPVAKPGARSGARSDAQEERDEVSRNSHEGAIRRDEQTADGDRLDAELRLIHRARAQAIRGSVAAALATLADYRIQFPEGKLAPEAKQLEVRLTGGTVKKRSSAAE
jgi:hypothetical protein